VQALTRVNAEQASKRAMRRADLALTQGRLTSMGKRATHAPIGRAGVVARACTKEEDRGNTGSPAAWPGRTANWRCASSRAGRRRVAEGCVVPLRPGNAGGGKAPWFKTNA